MKINVENGNIRIDKYLLDVLKLSRSKIQKLIKDNNVIVDGKVVSANFIVKDGMEINVDLDKKEESYEIEPLDIDINIVYEDDYIVIVDKPRGLVVHPAVGHKNDTLVNALIKKCKLSSDEVRPGIVHRIDKDTSGLLIVAKDEIVHEKLVNMIKNKEVVRKYIALVHGVINHDTGTIDAPIGRDITDRKKMAVTDINAKDAITHFRVLEKLNNATLIECQLETGRTHQIRVHMKYIGYPIVNDPVYGHKKTINDCGQMLHSYYLSLNHPITGEFMEFRSEIPKEMKEIIDMFR